MAMTVEEALEIAQSVLGHLSKVQEIVFRQSWEDRLPVAALAMKLVM